MKNFKESYIKIKYLKKINNNKLFNLNMSQKEINNIIQIYKYFYIENNIIFYIKELFYPNLMNEYIYKNKKFILKQKIFISSDSENLVFGYVFNNKGSICMDMYGNEEKSIEIEKKEIYFKIIDKLYN